MQYLNIYQHFNIYHIFYYLPGILAYICITACSRYLSQYILTTQYFFGILVYIIYFIIYQVFQYIPTSQYFPDIFLYTTFLSI